MLTDKFEAELLSLLPRLRRFAAGLVRGRSDPDDLCQATLERVLRSRDQWQAGTRLDSWTYRIMRNIWIDETRAAARRSKSIADGEDGSHVGVQGDQEASLLRDDIERALDRLPPEQREAVILVLVEGYAYKEASEIIGCPVGTLTSRLVRGRDTLMRIMGEAA